MSKLFLPLEEALRNKTIKVGDKIDIMSLYPDDGKQVILHFDETGHKEEQTIGRDAIEFFYAPDKEGLTTFWGRTTPTKIRLEGEIGAENGEAVIYKACQPFSNLRMGLKARATTEKDIIYLKDNEETLKRLYEDKNTAWLGSSCVYTGTGSAWFSVRIVDYGHVGGYGLFGSSGNYGYDSYGVRPAVSPYLMSKILVDMEKSEKGIWQLVPTDIK